MSKSSPEHNTLKEARAATMLSALGNESRLRIYRLLVRAGPEGLSVGAVQSRLAIPASTLAHHLAALRNAGLIGQQRNGRMITNSANYAAMDGLVDYLTEACCVEARPASARETAGRRTEEVEG